MVDGRDKFLVKGKRTAKFNGGHRVVDRRSDFNRESGNQARARLKTLDDLDRRSRALRHAKKMIADIENDLGGYANTTRAQRELIKRAAMISVLLGDMETRWLRHEEALTTTKYVPLVNAQQRILAELGLKRVTRDVTPSIDEYARRRLTSVDAEAADE